MLWVAGLTVPFEHNRAYGDRNGRGLLWFDVWHHYEHDPNCNLGSFRRGSYQLPQPLKVARTQVRFPIGRSFKVGSYAAKTFKEVPLQVLTPEQGQRAQGVTAGQQRFEHSVQQSQANDRQGQYVHMQAVE